MATLSRMKTGTGYQLSIERAAPDQPVKIVGWDGITESELVSMTEADFIIFAAVAANAAVAIVDGAAFGGAGEARRLEGLR